MQPLTVTIGNPRYRQTKRKNPTRTEERKLVRDFIGVDGEGVTYRDESRDWYDVMSDGSKFLWEGKRHEYVLLSVGSESLHRGGQRLSTLDIFEFLWEQFCRNPKAIFVGFYLAYDFTQWLRDLPENRANILLSTQGIAKRQRKVEYNLAPFPVEWQGWEFDLLDMRRFKLRPQGHKGKYLWVNDVGGFFQTSFLTAIEPKKWPEPILSDLEFSTIKEGKESRSTAGFDPAMIKYNTLENDVLARMIKVLATGFDKMGVKLNSSQWYGPGQAAGKWLSIIKAPDKNSVEYNVPIQIQEAARASYTAGWFEIFAHGHIPGIVYEYDINSAYPYAIARLPCLEHGKWSRNVEETGWTLVDATVRGSHRRIGTMPHRTADGAICRPHSTRGWYWFNELLASINAGGTDSYIIHDAWNFDRFCHHEPFSDIASLYINRLNIGKNTPLGMAYKLVYNSAYGKLAQSVGSPRYANPIYASLITSSCRTMVWNAIASHPVGADAVTMVATDAVYFREPHPYLPISQELGEWDRVERMNMCQFMPGLYWDDAARAGGKVKSRGVAAGDLSSVIDQGDALWKEFPNKLPISMKDWKETSRSFNTCLAYPRLGVPIKFGLISARLAIHRNSWQECGAVVNGPKYLSGSPHDKRDPYSAYVEDGVTWTRPYDISDRLESTPYEKRFGLELRDNQTVEDIITPNGVVDDEIYEWVKNNV